MTAVRLLDIRDAPLSLDEVYAAVTDPAAGGICVFIGTVRDHDEGQDVSALGYSSHPTALARLRDVAERIADRVRRGGPWRACIAWGTWSSATWLSSSRHRRHTGRRRSRRAGG